ncbi:bifunctional tRNA (5-methylaminomethyl-2-thiouridine)(34)-methyltransferase MnmD/FAD-dependent 5-carboxymethylaminomethyl-2-thiouridine(34) oxidoreductase MnmC [Vibrio sp. SCSIO 43136]|uniref:bifunctional tRNA (5-methylaminomethyl-2-thiouridine)(34)-methyltransferase MnmD/FAD-dependent 5-carboxymethylaminomethyl-2-thiouridine(34) oxidoreductase MnmC n=1 Tax=Vibrio sp. SCSIO 43136 TaxID=2819101 RepID=UPI0020758A03|nr:bifunctional tRNA (5-methylaminomethyl-2-thiouridine)(34)-methyltransferase MnmD/FAD-dependent 5-carboxymethylaminomethyl-2-thiouridine(34) oxidoreductase MnmC [Vibrio sp. SCSIO 43136]USD66025.1 bifunctional tRNA (5-methylaminomethyl-2-thiouridine)(34)-methyltransferase MnmD/FAD-dependent 5-carboxymethylaminomethyl-2-thiouridine(34) oxidoreductase MnmC [Vibrio sp. SCSIO 43136]
MTTIKNAKLEWNDVGTPVSDQFDDVYFSNVDGLAETRYVFLEKNQLPHRWHDFGQQRFVVGETGFGTGLNFLALWHLFDNFRQENPDSTVKELHFVSFEKFPVTKEDLEKAHQSWPELAQYAEQLRQHYPIAVPECHRIVLADGAVTLDLWFGDIKDCMPKVPTPESGIIDAWFLDGFAPSKNPEMWNQELFNGMVKLAKQDCTCATFTAAGFVRRGLIEAGFEMKKTKGFGTKRDMIVGHVADKQPYTNIKPWYFNQGSEDIQDVAIIGGGIASATLATTLARRGIKTTLYCQDDEPAQGASGNRQGAVYPLLNGNHEGVSRLFAPAFLFSRQFVDQAAAQGIEFDHDWCGVTQLAWDEASHTKLGKIAKGGFDHQLMHWLDAEQTNDNIGQAVDMPSVHYPLGGWLCPQQLTTGLFEKLETKGTLTASYNTKIDQLTWDEESQQWHLSHGDLKAQHQVVVIANGHEFNQLAPTQKLPLSAVKGQVSHIPTTTELSKIKPVLCYDGYMTPVNPNNQHHCIGASYDRSNIDTKFDEAAQRDNGEKLSRCVPNQTWVKDVDTSDNHARQGVRCVTRDHIPFVGNVADFDSLIDVYQDLQHQSETNAENTPLHPNLYCLLGLGSRGLSSAPLMAETLASVICNQPIPLPVDVLEMIHPGKMWVRKLRKGKAITEA